MTEPIRLVVINADAAVHTIQTTPDKTLDTLREYIGGTIDVIRLTHLHDGPLDMWCHDEYLYVYKDQPNRIAMSIVAHLGTMEQATQRVNGPVVLAGTTPEGETVSAPESILDWAQSHVLFSLER
jgi:hypothetical protein